MSLIISTPVSDMGRAYQRRWAALAVLCLSLLLIVMANTSLIVAAPAMTADLQLSSADLQWVIDAYTVPYAALMLMLGGLGDRYSRRGMLVIGLALFAVGSLVGAEADTVAGIIVGRAVMGTAAAMIMPATLSLIITTFPAGERASAITVWTATSGLAIAAGPLLSGALLSHFSWPTTFLVNLPIAGAAALLALWLVPPSRAHHAGRLDLLGGMLSVVGIAALVYAIIEGVRDGWRPSVIIAAIVAVLALGGFMVWELYHPNPLLDLRKFSDRGFAGANLAVLLLFLTVFGAIYYLSQHLQFVLGSDPLATGIRLLPLAAAVFVGAGITGVATPRLGLRITVPIGMALGTAALALLTQVTATSEYPTFVPPLVLLGLATGLSVSPCTELIMRAFPEPLLGVGGAVNDTSLELGGSLGIALLGSLLATTYGDRVGTHIPPKTPEPQVHSIQESIGGALAVAQRLDMAGAHVHAADLYGAAHAAFAYAVAQTSQTAALILGVGTVAVAAILPSGRRADTHTPANEQSS